ncbi:BRCT domain-containing protein [Tenacibaculum halocynthiae]|uniref:BRCT domain-containing protein n=1 Tax=Tenacibaculum halocynthiae TaxID=1254437 RepID=UPI003D65B5B5
MNKILKLCLGFAAIIVVCIIVTIILGAIEVAVTGNEQEIYISAGFSLLLGCFLFFFLIRNIFFKNNTKDKLPNTFRHYIARKIYFEVKDTKKDDLRGVPRQTNIKEVYEDEILKIKSLGENLFGIFTQENIDLGVVSSKYISKILKLNENGGKILVLAKKSKGNLFSICLEIWNEKGILDKKTFESFLPPIEILKSKEIISDNSEAFNNGWSDEEFLYSKSRKIDRQYLYPKKELENTSHFFYNKKVVITGQFDYYPYRNKMAKILWEVGADVDTAITERTDIAVVGSANVGPKKMEKIIENNIHIIRENEFIKYFPNSGYKK